MTQNPKETPAEQKTILLVEDDRSIRRYMQVALEKAGYRVLQAEDGLEGMKTAMTTTVDAVITDAIMPNLSGYELTRFLRNNPKFSNIPIIVLSGLESQDTAQQTEDGADLHLMKPVRPEDLKQSLDSLFNQKVPVR
jgi:CheY-like chemotaxis protein